MFYHVTGWPLQFLILQHCNVDNWEHSYLWCYLLATETLMQQAVKRSSREQGLTALLSNEDRERETGSATPVVDHLSNSDNT